MKYGPTVALHIPGSTNVEECFPLRLKYSLSKEPAQYYKADRLLILSKVNEDFSFLQHLLIANEVIDKNFRWTFGDGHLVILNDLFDVDRMSIESFWLIYSLEERARRYGGYVHFILGNRGDGNVNDNWRFTHPVYAKSKKILGSYKTALYDGNNEIWRWIQTKNVIERIGNVLLLQDSGFLRLSQVADTIEGINELARLYNFSNWKREREICEVVFSNYNERCIDAENLHSVDIERNQFKNIIKKFGATSIVASQDVVIRVASFLDHNAMDNCNYRVTSKSRGLLILNDVFFDINDGE